MSQLLLPAAPRRLALPPARPRLVPPTFREIGHGIRPGDGLRLSFGFHLMVLLVIALSAPIAALKPTVIAVAPQLEASRSASIYLPPLGGGHQGRGKRGGGTGRSGKTSTSLQAQGRRGFAYPGPQVIVSNPPQAKLGMQTILQEMRDLPRLPHDIPLPNLVRPSSVVSDAGHKEPPIKIRSGEHQPRTKVEKAATAPQIVLPVARANHKIASLAKSEQLLPTRAVPEPVNPSELKNLPRNQRGLLVLNAIALPPDVKADVPVAEERSRFVVSPEESAVIANSPVGTKAGEQTAATAGSGGRADSAHGDALIDLAAGGDGSNPSFSGAGTGSGGRQGNRVGSGMSSEDGARGTGRGTSSGSGLGTGLASGDGSGGGAGSAPGSGGFRGITIQGGRYGNGPNGSLLANPAPRRQTSYGMTIVSTGHGGGGLPDLGIFRNEKVYTVYLDMRASDDDSTPSWTLQYALLRPGDDLKSGAARTQATPTPPYAMHKEIPEFAPDLLRKCEQRLIIASAIMGASGKLERVAIVQSPATELAAPVVEALERWMFQPAQLDGQPVALRVLLGIRLSAPR